MRNFGPSRRKAVEAEEEIIAPFIKVFYLEWMMRRYDFLKGEIALGGWGLELSDCNPVKEFPSLPACPRKLGIRTGLHLRRVALSDFRGEIARGLGFHGASHSF